MTRILILVLILFEVSQLFASENEDFTFIVGLYRDENYDLAQAELIRFLDSYPVSDYVSDAEYLLANIYLYKGLFNDAQVIYYRLYLRYTNPAIRDNVLLGLAQSYFYLEDMEQSSKYFLIFNAEFPGHPLLWKSFYFLGRISVSKGETSKALRYYDESIRLKDAPEAYLAKLELLLETDKEKKTGEFLSEITKKFSGTTTSDKALLLFQDFHLNDRSYDKVLEIPYQVASSSVLYPEYKVNRAAAHYEKGEARLALSELASVRTDRAEYYRALSYRQLQRNEEARAILLELEKSALSEELRVYSSFMLAEMEDDMALRNLRLMEFITRHPDSDFNGVAYYQIGFNKHEAGNYDDAVQNLEKSLLLDLDAETREKAVFLLAESQYQSGSLQESNSGYKFYLDNYSQGSYCDEALFKIGLIHYRQEEWQETRQELGKLLKKYSTSSKTAMANFYLAEIELQEGNYEKAKSYYVQALDGESDKGMIWLRLAEIYHLTENYHQALNAIDKVPDDEPYHYRKYLLKGNIYYALKSYDMALQEYSYAETGLTDKTLKVGLLDRKARTLYQMKRFAEAASVYEQLTAEVKENDIYIIKAATAAFGDENYTKAIDLYYSYIRNFPQGDQILNVHIGIADSYYNLGDYTQAATSYASLITYDIPENILQAALSGLEWSCEQSEQIDFRTDMERLLVEISDNKKKKIILQRKVEFELGQNAWQEALSDLEQLREYDLGKDEMRMLLKNQARAYSGLQEYQKAESIYQELLNGEKEDDIYIAWSDLKLQTGDYPGAIQELRQGAMLGSAEDLWLRLLQMESAQDHPLYKNDHARFMEFATGRNREEAMILFLEWQIEHDQAADPYQQVQNLLNSKYKDIVAGAQYLQGLLLYKDQMYREAVPQLLRIRYLYPEIVDYRIKAEFLACLAYIRDDKPEEAERLYNSIREELNADQNEQILQALQKKGR